MPGEVEIIDTLGQRAFRTVEGNAVYVVSIVKNLNIKVDNPESLDEFLDGMAKGFAENTQKKGLKAGKPQTIHIDSIEGRYMRCYSNNPELEFREWIAHMFLVNGTAYSIVVAYVAGSTAPDKANLTHLIKSIDFTSSSTVTEKTFATKADAMGFKIGEIIGSAIIPLAIVGLVLFFALRKKKSRPRN